MLFLRLIMKLRKAGTTVFYFNVVIFLKVVIKEAILKLGQSRWGWKHEPAF